MKRSFNTVLLCLVIFVFLSSTAEAVDWFRIADKAAGKFRVLPGVAISATLITPETYWCFDRDVLSSNEAATRRLADLWPTEQKKGLRVHVYVSTKFEDLDVDWQAARIRINGGISTSPVSLDIPSTISADKQYGELGNIVFPFDWTMPLSSVTLELPPILAGIDPPVFTWDLPLDFPDEVTNEVASVIGSSPRPVATKGTAKLAKDTSLMTGTDGASQGELLFGTDVSVLEMKGDWAKVSVTGWIPSENLMNLETSSESAEDSFTVVYMDEQTNPPSASRTSGSQSAGEGFSFRNVSFKQVGRFAQVVGEIENTNSTSYSFAMFTLTVYGPSGSIAGVGNIIMQNIRGNSTKTFQTMMDAELPTGFTYRIQFENAL